jgi:hypothetical protein
MKKLLLTIFLISSVYSGDMFHSAMYSSGSLISKDEFSYTDGTFNGEVISLGQNSEKSFTNSVYHLTYRYGLEEDTYRAYGQLGVGTGAIALLSADFIFSINEIYQESKLFLGASVGTSTWIWQDTTGEDVKLASKISGFQTGVLYQNFELGYRYFILKGDIAGPKVNLGFDVTRVQTRTNEKLSEIYIAYNF